MQGRRQFLRGRPRRFGWFRAGPAPAVPHVIERQVPRDTEHPRSPGVVVCRRYRPANDAQEHFLREVAGGVAVADEPAQVPEHAVAMGGEEGRRRQPQRMSQTVKTPGEMDRRTQFAGVVRRTGRDRAVAPSPLSTFSVGPQAKDAAASPPGNEAAGPSSRLRARSVRKRGAWLAGCVMRHPVGLCNSPVEGSKRRLLSC